TFEISQAGDLILSALADVSAAPNLTDLAYRSTAGSLTLSGSSNTSSIPIYSTNAALTLEATGAITIGQNANALQIKVPSLSLDTDGAISIGSGADLQVNAAAGDGGFSVSGGSVSIAGGLSTANAASTTINATAGSLNLAASARLTGLKGAITLSAVGNSSDLEQAAALGNNSLTSAISLTAGRSILSSAPITTAAALSLTATGGNIATAEEIYTTTDKVLVDKLGYRVNSSGAFVNAAGSQLSGSEKPVYAGSPALPSSGGAIRAGSLNATAQAGTISLAGSVLPAGAPSVTTLTATAEGFNDGNDTFTIPGHDLSTGTAVRFYGVQDGALLPLVDGGLYYAIRTGTDTFRLALTATDAATGVALALSRAAHLTAGTLATLSPELTTTGMAVALTAQAVDVSGTIQSESLALTATQGNIRLLEEAWLSTGHTTLRTPAKLLIDRTRTDLRRAILTADDLSLAGTSQGGVGGLDLKGFLDLRATGSTRLQVAGEASISGELTAADTLDLVVGGRLTVVGAGSIEAAGDLNLQAEDVQLAADATRPGWELTTVPSAVTPVTSTTSVATGSSLSPLRLAFEGDVALRVDAATDILTFVGVDGTPLPHGLASGAVLYYQNGTGNGSRGRAGLVNTATDVPDQATAYTVQVLDDARLQLLRNTSTVDLSDATSSGDALVGLDPVDTQVETSTTTITPIGTQEVQVGHEWFTYDLALDQDAFYRPASDEIREYVVPGVDFSLSAITWGEAGTPQADLGWEQYNTHQRDLVLAHLGYRPLHTALISNTVKHTSRNGVLTSAPEANPPWANSATKIWLPSNGDLAGMAIAGTTDAMAKVVSLESFESLSASNTDGWSFAGQPSFSTGGAFYPNGSSYTTRFLGAFGHGERSNGQDAWKTYGLDGGGASVSFRLYRLDSWDGEAFRIYANNGLIFETALAAVRKDSGSLQTSTDGYSVSFTPRDDYGTFYGVSNWQDQSYDVVVTVPAGVSSLKLGFGSSLDQPASDEAYGIDALTVVNAPTLYSTTNSGSTTSAEWVGTAKDTAPVRYTQETSALQNATLTQTIVSPPGATVSGTAQTLKATLADNKNDGGSRWAVTLAKTNSDPVGHRTYTISGLRTGLTGAPSTSVSQIARDPDWADNSTTTDIEGNQAGGSPAFGSHRGQDPFLLGVSPRTALETFDSSPGSWRTPSGPAPVKQGGTYYGTFLGPFANGSKSNGQDVWRQISMDGNGGTISFQLNRLDSWDNEIFRIYINNDLIFSRAFSLTQFDQPTAFSTNNHWGWKTLLSPRNDWGEHYGNPGWAEQTYDVTIEIPVGATSFQLGFGSSLDSGSGDESYGIDNFSVINASQLPGLRAPSHAAVNLDYVSSTASLTNRTNVSTKDVEVGSLSQAAPLYLGLSGSDGHANARSLAESMRVKVSGTSGTSTSDASSSDWLGFSRLARLTSQFGVGAVVDNGALFSGQWHAVDGYQPSNDSRWLYFDNVDLRNLWGSTQSYLVTPWTTWANAKDLAIGYDGQLVKVESDTENATIKNLYSQGASSSAWIGASRPSYGADFKWIDGTSLGPYQNWAPGQPSNDRQNISTVFFQAFESDTNGFTGTKREGSQGYTNGLFHGRYSKGGPWDTSKTRINLDPNRGTEITYDFLRIDSWDYENMRFYIQTNLGTWDLRQSFTTAQAGNFVLLDEQGFKLSFSSKQYGQFLREGKWADEIFGVTLSMPAGVTYCDLSWDAELNDNVDDESWGMDNFKVIQFDGEPYAAINWSGDGKWSDVNASAYQQAIVELTVPNLPWRPGQPDDGGGTSTGRNEQNYLGLNSDGLFSDGANSDAKHYITQISPVWGAGRTLFETYVDYQYDWTSIDFDIRDPRVNPRYGVTTTPISLVETQPLYHQEDTITSSTVVKLAPRLVNQTVYTTQTVTTGVSTTTTSDARLSEAVPFDSIKGR
ncbi:MAG: lectin-like protein, partial [Prochlorococcaceae cyanobacterium]